MEFHPSQVPVAKTFEVTDEKAAYEVAESMVEQGFTSEKKGYKILMPKESRTAKRIGYIITTGVNYGLRQKNVERDIRYWTYHHDKDHYAIVLVSSKVLEEIGLNF